VLNYDIYQKWLKSLLNLNRKHHSWIHVWSVLESSVRESLEVIISCDFFFVISAGGYDAIFVITLGTRTDLIEEKWRKLNVGPLLCQHQDAFVTER
jgi:hypothetical protein